MKRYAHLIVVTALFVVISQTIVGQGVRGVPLPSLPSSEAIAAVVSDTNGAVFTPLYMPGYAVDQLNAFGAPFDSITLDNSQAVHYITNKGNLLETLVPVAGLGSETLAPDMNAPRKNPDKLEKPGKVIGAWFQPDLGVRWVVVIFKANGEPAKIRFYRADNGFEAVPVVKGKFNDDDGDGLIEPVDEGAVIADKLSCITVGLDQVCWKPVNHAAIRDETKPKKKIDKAVKQFAALYDIGKFASKTAVPDLLGLQQRADCAAYLATAAVFSSMVPCEANAILATSKDAGPGDPIAMLILLNDANVRTYNAAGEHIGDTLPADKYLVLATPVSSTEAGTATALFLVGLSGNTYMIPSTIMQGFGEGTFGDTGQAGIRDGFARYRLFGW